MARVHQVGGSQTGGEQGDLGANFLIPLFLIRISVHSLLSVSIHEKEAKRQNVKNFCTLGFIFRIKPWS